MILSNTGIALLAYMDGVNDTRTLAGVVIGAASSAGSAIYKVFFKRIFGDVSFCQVAIFFTMIGLSSLILLWPFFLAFYLSGHGIMSKMFRFWILVDDSFLLQKPFLGAHCLGLRWLLPFFCLLVSIFLTSQLQISMEVERKSHKKAFFFISRLTILISFWGRRSPLPSTA